MAYILLPSRWIRQPQYPVELRSRFVSPGSTLCLLPPVSLTKNLSYGPDFSIAGTPTRGVSPAGVGFIPGTGGAVFTQAVDLKVTEAFFVVLQFFVRSSAGTLGIFALQDTITDGTPRFIYQNNGGDLRAYISAGYRVTESGVGAANTLHTVVIRNDGLGGGSGSIGIHRNGAFRGSYSPPGSTANDYPYFGNGFNGSADVVITLGVASKVLISQDEATAISAAPYGELFSPIQRRIYVPSAGGGAVTGDASITLDALTTSAAGKLAIAGTLSSTLGSLTSSAAGALAINGSASLTLGALTATADADLALRGSASITLADLTAAAEADLLIAGSAAVTLGDITLAANGTVLAAGTGSAAITLGEMTASATGAVSIAGTLGVTLGDITVSAAGELSLQPGEGAASITLDALTATATGTLAIAGQAAVTLGDMTAAATGAVDIAGALGVTLGDLKVSATGAEVAPDTRTGTAAITLADLTMAAFNAPALTRLGNRRLRSSAPRLQKNDMPAGTRFRKGRLPSIY